VIIDVDNRMQGIELAIHWHGIHQRGTQYYDGVPFLTQCPIPEGTTFRYQWNAEQPGTHFFHAHTGQFHFLIKDKKKETLQGNNCAQCVKVYHAIKSKIKVKLP
jgi:FtsP/CotA-like multicopper oxidase with cupredoxin domain